MTERMENALNHIKTSVDVDPWAVEEVERVFNAVDDIKAEIEASRYGLVNDGLDLALNIIDKHTKG